MAPSKAPTTWDDEDSDSSSGSSSAGGPAPVVRRSKFDDEEEDSDVLESWDAAEDSEVEREKAKAAAEAKARADAAAKANHKTKTQRIEEKREAARLRKLQEDGDESDEDETEAERRARTAASEKESDLAHAEDLFGNIGISNNRGAVRPVTLMEGDDPADAIDLSSLKIFNPNTVKQFLQLRQTLVPLLANNARKPQFASFMAELSKELVKELSSDQVKKIASSLSTISNEKMKEEKAADKTGKKTKAAKTKATLSANRNVAVKADTTLYEDDGLDDGDFM